MENNTKAGILDVLSKTNYNGNLKVGKDYINNSKNKITNITKKLLTPTNEFDPGQIISDIKNYIQNNETKGRIIYSDISSFIFELSNDNEKGCVLTNVEYLLNYALGKGKELDDDSCKFIIKLYDHCNLANNQRNMTATLEEQAQKIIISQVDDSKKKIQNFEKELKNKEREYITILGIFASIVLAFVGGVTFSSSVLQNIHKVNFYRLIIVVDLIGFVCFNMIYALTYFIRRINKQEINENGKSKKELGKIFYIINAIFLLILIAIIVIWIVKPCLFIDL